MILARSPYIVTINEPSQEATRLELFLWNGTGSAPATPTYSLSKKVPSINNLTTYYNIAPFIREFFDFTQSSPIGTTNAIANQYSYCNVQFKRYYTLDGVETLLNTVTDKAFDGFGYFNDGSNYSGQFVFLSDLSNYGNSNTYYYDCNSDAGTLTMNAFNLTTLFWRVKYTNLRTGATQIVSITDDRVALIEKVYTGWENDGNKLEIYTTSLSIPPNITNYGTYYFVPKCECRYDVITCDFVNRWGSWQREFFYKASNETLEMTNNQFKLNPTVFPAYQLDEGQVKTFNTNGKTTIKTNTGWVEENYKQVVEEIMLSEVIRINGQPATIKTKSVEKYKHINQKTINYQLEFDLAFDVINSVS